MSFFDKPANNNSTGFGVANNNQPSGFGVANDPQKSWFDNASGGTSGFGVATPAAGSGFGVAGGSSGFGAATPSLGFDTDGAAQRQAKLALVGNSAVRSVRVLSCNFIEQVRHNNMGFRPYVSNVVDSNVLEKIPEFVRNAQTKTGYKAASFNPIVNDIIGLSGSSLGTVPIVNGWNIKRYSFAIQAEVVTSNGSVQGYIIEGFTDTDSISTQMSRVCPDKDMVLYVNNVTSFATRSNLHTGSLTLMPVENYNVIASASFDQSANLRSFSTQRPYDLANAAIDGALLGNAGLYMGDARSSITTDLKTSTLANNNLAVFLSKIINDGVSAMGSNNTDNLFNHKTLNTMTDFMAEPMLGTNGFLQQLGRVNRDYACSVTNFTWGELTQLDTALLNPNCTYLNVFTTDNRPSFMPPDGSFGEDINGSGMEQLYATTIANGLSDALAQCRAVTATIVATNHSGVDVVTCTGMECFNNSTEEIKSQKALMEMLFLQNIIMMLNTSRNLSYNIFATVSLYSETYVKINLGYGDYSFLLPNFANSMFSPILTNNKSDALKVGKHMMSLATTISSEEYKLHEKYNNTSSI